jgi:aspartate racemase
MRTIGLIGGLSWRSTAFYYAAVHSRLTEMEGCDHGVPILIWSVRHLEFYSAIRHGDRAKAAQILVTAANGVVSGGAACVAVACNSAHMFADDLIAAIEVKFIDIRDVVGRVIQRSGYRRVGLLATSFTVNHGLYRRLIERGFAHDIVVPAEDDQCWLDSLIFDGLCNGSVRDGDATAFAAIVGRLAASGAEVAVLGCTELNLLGVANCPVPVIDSAAMHAHELAEWAARQAEPIYCLPRQERAP